MAVNAKRDIYRTITDEIVLRIEQGAGTFEMPWHRSGSVSRPKNARTGRPYSGVNILSLWIAADAHNYGSGYWATYRQWLELGAQVTKGERGTVIVFYKKMESAHKDDSDDDTEPKTHMLARASWVFNCDQVAGWSPPESPLTDRTESLTRAESFVADTHADIRHGGERAFYSPSGDYIQMPDRERFNGTSTSTATESYYATILHELTHWTGHQSRLGRDLTSRFKEQAYAMEELVAELGAAFLCADLGIASAPRPDHAAYIAGWLQVLRNDTKAIFSASSKASEAAAYLSDLQHQKHADKVDRPSLGCSRPRAASNDGVGDKRLER